MTRWHREIDPEMEGVVIRDTRGVAICEFGETGRLVVDLEGAVWFENPSVLGLWEPCLDDDNVAYSVGTADLGDWDDFDPKYTWRSPSPADYVNDDSDYVEVDGEVYRCASYSVTPGWVRVADNHTRLNADEARAQLDARRWAAPIRVDTVGTGVYDIKGNRVSSWGASHGGQKLVTDADGEVWFQWGGGGEGAVWTKALAEEDIVSEVSLESRADWKVTNRTWYRASSPVSKISPRGWVDFEDEGVTSRLATAADRRLVYADGQVWLESVDPGLGWAEAHGSSVTLGREEAKAKIAEAYPSTWRMKDPIVEINEHGAYVDSDGYGWAARYDLVVDEGKVWLENGSKLGSFSLEQPYNPDRQTLTVDEARKRFEAHAKAAEVKVKAPIAAAAFDILINDVKVSPAEAEFDYVDPQVAVEPWFRHPFPVRTVSEATAFTAKGLGYGLGRGRRLVVAAGEVWLEADLNTTYPDWEPSSGLVGVEVSVDEAKAFLDGKKQVDIAEEAANIESVNNENTEETDTMANNDDNRIADAFKSTGSLIADAGTAALVQVGVEQAGEGMLDLAAAATKNSPVAQAVLASNLGRQGTLFATVAMMHLLGEMGVIPKLADNAKFQMFAGMTFQNAGRAILSPAASEVRMYLARSMKLIGQINTDPATAFDFENIDDVVLSDEEVAEFDAQLEAMVGAAAGGEGGTSQVG